MSTATTTAAPSAPARVEHEGFSVASNTGTVEDLQHELGVDQPDPTTQHANDADTDADADPNAPPTGKIKARDAHGRIAKTTYEREEANRQREAAETRARELEAENARLKAERERPREEPARRTEDDKKRYEQWKAGHDESDPKPTSADQYNTYEEFLDARDDWNERRIERKNQRAEQEHREYQRHQSMQQAATKFQTTIDAEIAKDPEFKAIVDRVQIPAGPILDVFLTTEIPVALARYLDANPQKLQALIDEPSRGKQLAGIKKIEGFVEAQLELGKTAAPSGSAPAPKTTKAHPPINPVVGSHVAASDQEPGDDATDAEWFAWEERQRKAKR